MPARASGLRTGVLFCLLSFDAKTSFTVVIVVKDNLLGLLCRTFTQILGRFAMFYESFYESGGCTIDREIWETLDSRNNNWFNDTYGLNLTKTDLVDLLHVATKGQLFQFDGALYEQTDGVAMGSPLGPLLANVFMCSIEESLKSQGKLPDFYRRYVDDTLVKMPDLAAATAFLDTLNHAHSAVSFTMEVEENRMLPFLGLQLLNRAPCVETKVYVKPTNTGLLLHYHSHVDRLLQTGFARHNSPRKQALQNKTETPIVWHGERLY